MSVVFGVLFGLVTAVFAAGVGGHSLWDVFFDDFVMTALAGTAGGAVVAAPIAFVVWCFLAVAAKRREPPKWYERR